MRAIEQLQTQISEVCSFGRDRNEPSTSCIFRKAPGIVDLQHFLLGYFLIFSLVCVYHSGLCFVGNCKLRFIVWWCNRKKKITRGLCLRFAGVLYKSSLILERFPNEWSFIFSYQFFWYNTRNAEHDIIVFIWCKMIIFYKHKVCLGCWVAPRIPIADNKEWTVL